jgi:hypothetical protein
MRCPLFDPKRASPQDAGTIHSTVVCGFCFYRPWIVMAVANARTEAAIITKSGFTTDFADFAIAVPSDRRKRAAYFLQMCF